MTSPFFRLPARDNPAKTASSRFAEVDFPIEDAVVGSAWQPWVAMGAAKSAMECLCRYFAVALARRKITVNIISPSWIEDSVLNTLPEAAQNRNWHQGGWTPMGRLGTSADIWKRCGSVVLARGRSDYRQNTEPGKLPPPPKLDAAQASLARRAVDRDRNITLCFNRIFFLKFTREPLHHYFVFHL
jgi:NAD(P)-dependent dehydrogenase (short-subunit alcohol dehydrogenase family)